MESKSPLFLYVAHTAAHSPLQVEIIIIIIMIDIIIISNIIIIIMYAKQLTLFWTLQIFWISARVGLVGTLRWYSSSLAAAGFWELKIGRKNNHNDDIVPVLWDGGGTWLGTGQAGGESKRHFGVSSAYFYLVLLLVGYYLQCKVPYSIAYRVFT